MCARSWIFYVTKLKKVFTNIHTSLGSLLPLIKITRIAPFPFKGWSDISTLLFLENLHYKICLITIISVTVNKRQAAL